MGKLFSICILLFIFGTSFASITFEPTCNRSDVSIDTVEVEGITYHRISVAEYLFSLSGEFSEGFPSIPFMAQTFLLPPNTAVDKILITSASWDTLPGRYHLLPAQSDLMEETALALPDPDIYTSSAPFPAQPVKVTRQGSAMGYSVVSLAGTPVRYIPADGLLMVLTSVSLDIQTCISENELIVPVRETEWSASIRERGILCLVDNPSAISLYQQPAVCSRVDRTVPLNILDSPSLEGDGVDMVIITSGPDGPGPDLTSAFQELADYRTAQGIITIVRTVGWIDNLYSGCDIQEKIRNFIIDAHSQWGVQAILLGGDDWIIPVRECSNYYFPSDDYYADIDGDWGLYSGYWQVPTTDYYVDLILGRWPVDDSDDIDLVISKLKLYECPAIFPANFARKALLIGGSNSGTDGYGGVYLEYLKYLLEQEGISGPGGTNLDNITELYYPQSGSRHCSPYGGVYPFSSQEELSRLTALAELDAGYNIIVHMDHSGTHEIGAAQQAGEYIHEYDFQSLTNAFEPSILWTAGCWPGHFEGADCFAEAGLLTSDETGLIAVISNARDGFWGDWRIYYPFIDALYPFGWVNESGPIQVGGVSTIGEAYRYSMNYENDTWHSTNSHKSMQNFFGDPAMFVWRDNPNQLAVETVPSTISAGTSNDITVTVSEAFIYPRIPVSAQVCLYKDGDLFAIDYTGTASGTVTFHDVEVTHTGQISVTVVKRRDYHNMEGVFNYIPEVDHIDVIGSPVALVNLERFRIDDDNLGQSQGNGDEVANPGETIELDIAVGNLGLTDATHLRAQLSLVSGNVLIEDDFEVIGFLAGGDDVKIQGAFVISIPEDIVENEPVQMKVDFIYDQGSWESPCDFTVLVDVVELPLHAIDVTYVAERNVTFVNVSNILAVNTGIGSVEDVEITLDSFSHGAVFSTVVSVVGDIVPGTSVEAPSMEAVCTDPPDEWTDDDYFPECTFCITATDIWDREIYREEIAVSDYNPEERPSAPSESSFEAVEAGQDYINVEWDNPSGFNGGYYLYVKNSNDPTWIRSNLLPIPVERYTYSGLESVTVYDLAVTAVDELGQESPFCEMENPVSTVCAIVEGWPIQLQGKPGSGPVSVNMDNDPGEEIVAVSSFGYVYIIERDGSMETIPPPVSLDFDRYVSCAVGDVDADGEEEIVVSYQVDIIDGTAGLLFFDRNVFGEWAAVIVDDEIGPGEFIHGAEIQGTPVLLQANTSQTLEIALRTTGNNSLYLWKWNPWDNSWGMYDNFPIDLSCFFSDPIAVDYDEDGFDELIVADLVSGKSQLHLVDFMNSGFTESFIDLSPELGDDARVFSSLASVEWNGNYYLAGVARRDYSEKKVFLYNLTGSPAPYMVWWHHDWQTGYDYYANMGGPAIGQLDSDDEPEIAYTLEGMCGWNLIPIAMEYPDPVWDENAGYMEWNHHAKYGGVGNTYTIRSAAVIGGSTTKWSNVQVPFTGFSTLCYGHDPQNQMNAVPGFPTWSEDVFFASPLIVDLDNCGNMECLTSDVSGLLTLYEWGGRPTSSGGWPMYQHDPWRTGFYNKVFLYPKELDLVLLGVKEVNSGSRRDENASITLLAEVEVTGSGVSAPLSAEVRSSSIPVANAPAAVRLEDNSSEESARTTEVDLHVIHPVADPIGYEYDSVVIALFSENIELSSTEFQLYDGIHVIELVVPRTVINSDDLLVRVDPDNEYIEAAEENNARAVGNLTVTAPSATRIYMQSPCESLVLNLDLLEAVSGDISIKVYSIDGRLVVDNEMTELGSGSHVLELSTSNVLPAGLYTVIIKGINEEELIRRVVVLP